MWRPPERVKHALPQAGWPTREAAAKSMLFAPIRIGPRTARARTWVPAMVPWRATDDGHVTDDVIDWYARFASGRPGVLVVEATGIRDVPSGPLLRIGHDRFVDGLAKLVRAVKGASRNETLVLIQLIDFLGIKRRPAAETYLARFLTITEAHRAWASQSIGRPLTLDDDALVRGALAGASEETLATVLSPRELDDMRMGFRERVTDDAPHIRELPQVLPGLFAAAARRAEASGFDGVELHFAHAYTMASFLSPRNTRTDGYGGAREQRVRLPLEVIAATKAAVREDTIVGCRFLGDEVIDDGGRIEDATFMGEHFARAGLDFLSVSKGGKFEDAKQPKVGAAAYPYTGRSGFECMPTAISDAKGPFARNVDLAQAIRATVRGAGFTTPVVTAGGMCDFSQAEGILQRGDADIIASARQTLADPDWFEKMRLGRGHDIRRCQFTNYCEALDQGHEQVTCQLWDREALDDAKTRSKDGKRRLVAPPWQP